MEPFTCPVCSKTSHHPQDAQEGYCGRCRWWTGNEVIVAVGVNCGECGLSVLALLTPDGAFVPKTCKEHQ
jgi:hypothetical protein